MISKSFPETPFCFKLYNALPNAFKMSKNLSQTSKPSPKGSQSDG